MSNGVEDLDPEKPAKVSPEFRRANGAGKNRMEAEIQQLSKKERKLLKKQHKQEEQHRAQRVKKTEKDLLDRVRCSHCRRRNS